MAIVFPTGDPASDKKLWWRCVFIAAAMQPVLVLLDLIFRLAFFRTILTIPYYPLIRPFFNNAWHSVEHADGVSAISQVAVFLPCCLLASCLTLSFSARSFISGTGCVRKILIFFRAHLAAECRHLTV